MFGDPLHNLWTRCILEFCGVKAVQRRNYEVLSPARRSSVAVGSRRRARSSPIASRRAGSRESGRPTSSEAIGCC